MIIKPQTLVKLTDEAWKEIPLSGGQYFISNYGRVKSFAYDKKNGRILNPGNLKGGFKTVSLWLENNRKTYYVHHLVAKVWLSKPLDGQIFVIHLDGNNKNNRSSNLIWMSKIEMLERQREIIKTKNIHRRSHSKLSESDVKFLKSLLKKNVNQTKLSKLFCISQMQISRIKRNENWGYLEPL